MEKTAQQFRLLSDPTRLKILNLLISEDREFCVYEIANTISVSPSATSHQLAKLEAYEIVDCYRDGQTMCYTLCNNKRTKLITQLLDLVNI